MKQVLKEIVFIFINSEYEEKNISQLGIRRKRNIIQNILENPFSLPAIVDDLFLLAIR